MKNKLRTEEGAKNHKANLKKTIKAQKVFKTGASSQKLTPEKKMVVASVKKVRFGIKKLRTK